jgi:hypothetical protein
MPSGPNYNLVANGKWENEHLLESIQNCLIATVTADLPSIVFPSGPSYTPAQGNVQGEPFLYGSIQNVLATWAAQKSFLIIAPDPLRTPMPYQQYPTNAILQRTQALMAYVLRNYLAAPNPGTPTYQPMVGITQTDNWYLTSLQNLFRSWAIGRSVTLPSGPQYVPFQIGQGATDNYCLWSIQNIFTKLPM